MEVGHSQSREKTLWQHGVAWSFHAAVKNTNPKWCTLSGALNNQLITFNGEGGIIPLFIMALTCLFL